MSRPRYQIKLAVYTRDSGIETGHDWVLPNTTVRSLFNTCVPGWRGLEHNPWDTLDLWDWLVGVYPT